PLMMDTRLERVEYGGLRDGDRPLGGLDFSLGHADVETTGGGLTLDLFRRPFGLGEGREIVREVELSALDEAEVGDDVLTCFQLIQLSPGVVELDLLVARVLILQNEIRDVSRGVLPARE